MPELLSELPQPQTSQLTVVLGVAGDRQSTDVLVTALQDFEPLHDAAGPHDHRLHSSWMTNDSGDRTLAVGLQGMSALATKYAVFSLLEEVGVGFRLHGQDAVPRLSVSDITERLGALHHKTMTPGAITTRGIQPFHDFSEGPDQWNEDDYRVHFEQLVKLKMNFIGLHTCKLFNVYPVHNVRGVLTQYAVFRSQFGADRLDRPSLALRPLYW
jgi:hypothetical protein